MSNIKSRFVAKSADGKVVYKTNIVEADFNEHDAHLDDVIRFSKALGAVTFSVVSY